MAEWLYNSSDAALYLVAGGCSIGEELHDVLEREREREREEKRENYQTFPNYMHC
jgi:hypothetical protein